jgi:DNA topoisomerase-6 subunit B
MSVHTKRNYRGISPSEFFYRNRQMAGFSNNAQALFSTIRELVENSLDACEDAGRLPEIEIIINTTQTDVVDVYVADNGTGVPPEHVPESFGRVLYGSKYSSRQRRGTFGLGVTMAILYGQITTNSPVIVETQESHTIGNRFSLYIDVEHNRPIVESVEAFDRGGPGTTVMIRMKGNLKRSQDKLLEYLRLTTVATPYCRLKVTIDDANPSTYGGFSTSLPDPPLVCKPHPRSADVEMLRRMIELNPQRTLRQFLINSFQQIGTKTASSFLQFKNMDPHRHLSTLNRDETAHLSESLRKYSAFKKPESKCLSPIGKAGLQKAVTSLFETQNVSYASVGPLEWDGNPFFIEGALFLTSSRSGSEHPQLLRFANRVPLLYDASDCVFTKVLKRVDWSRYDLGSKTPSILITHLCSTRVPYKAAGKQSIASIPEIELKSKSLYRGLGRTIGRLVKRARSSAREIQRKRELSRSLQLIAKFSAELADSKVPETVRLMESMFEVS